MATAIEETLATGGFLAVEGPTGVGKTRGYCVPSIQRVLDARNAPVQELDEDGKPRRLRTIIVTAGIPLQEQIVGKDLPALATVMDGPFSYRLFKGRNNYVCNLAASTADAKLGFSPLDTEIKNLVDWSRESLTGDRSELDTEPTAAAWRKLSTTSEDCVGKKACPAGESCFFERQRAAVKESDVIVCNYHVFFAHVSIYRQTGEHLVLPPHDVIVFDEAHDMVDIARDFFGWRIGMGSVFGITSMLKHIGHEDVISSFNERARTAFSAALEIITRPPPSYNARFRTADLYRRYAQPLINVMSEVAALFRDANVALPDKVTAEKVSKAFDKAKAMILRLKGAEADIESLSAAVFLEDEERDGLAAFVCREIDVGEIIADYLETMHAAIATSATMNMPLFLLESGFGRLKAKDLTVPSPFEYGKNVMLVIPEADVVPMPNDPSYTSATAATVARIADDAGGRLLGLFTSYRAVNATRQRLAGTGHRVLVQGDAPRTKLVQQFREDEASVLLGTDSLWTGVDVPGQSLSVVVIDKIPFDVPDDPIQSVLKDRTGVKYFNTFAIPRAIVRLKQGFGRLIRSTQDYGCVVILDRRVLESGYGAKFIDALPRTYRSRELGVIPRFLKAHADRVAAEA